MEDVIVLAPAHHEVVVPQVVEADDAHVGSVVPEDLLEHRDVLPRGTEHVQEHLVVRVRRLGVDAYRPLEERLFPHVRSAERGDDDVEPLDVDVRVLEDEPPQLVGESHVLLRVRRRLDAHEVRDRRAVLAWKVALTEGVGEEGTIGSVFRRGTLFRTETLFRRETLGFMFRKGTSLPIPSKKTFCRTHFQDSLLIFNKCLIFSVR